MNSVGAEATENLKVTKAVFLTAAGVEATSGLDLVLTGGQGVKSTHKKRGRPHGGMSRGTFVLLAPPIPLAPSPHSSSSQ